MVVVLGEADDRHSRVGGNQQTVYKSSFARIYPAFIHYALGHIQYTKYNMKKHTISNIIWLNFVDALIMEFSWCDYSLIKLDKMPRLSI